jgi:hypothetical protein
LGVGWVIWREEQDLPEEMIFWVNYLGGNMRDIALNFSRPGGTVTKPRLASARLFSDPLLAGIVYRVGVVARHWQFPHTWWAVLLIW